MRVPSSLPLCNECLAEVYRLSMQKCPECGKTQDECMCTGIKVLTLFAYSGPLARALIYGIKRSLFWEDAFFWGRMLKEKLDMSGENKFDAVTAVSSREAAKRRYGYGHAERLALVLAYEMNLPYVDMLYRKDNRQQKLLSASQRRKSIRESYGFLEESTRDPATGDYYKRVLLLDDVTTTGDTLKACRAILKKQGVRQVTCITIAKTI